MSKQQRTISYNRQPSDSPTRESYWPIPNSGLVKIIKPTDGVSPEYSHIFPYRSDPDKIGNRILRIISNSLIEMSAPENNEALQAELIGDARFVFNALLASRHTPQPMRSIANFNAGFRGSHAASITGGIANQLGRPIRALDHFALEATGDIMVERNKWGSGTQGKLPVMYQLKEDISVIDARIPQQ